MPKIRASHFSKARAYAREFATEFRVNPAGELFCVLCNCNVNCDKRFRVEKHRDTAKHKNCMLSAIDTNPTTTKLVQQFLPTTKKDFKEKIVEAFLAADIPLKKLRHPHIVKLFTDLGQGVPSESACREHVHVLASAETVRVKDSLIDKKIFMVIDESEVDGTKYLNVLVGDVGIPERTYMLDCSEIAIVDQHRVSAKIDDCLRILNCPRENFVLFLSDAASYMTASSTALKTLYPRLFHVTCLAHMLHNCAERVRSFFLDVDNLIARIKALTVKHKARRALFHEIGSPPQPVTTRWGSWLTAADYYADNLPQVKQIVSLLKSDGMIVRRAKEAVNDPNVSLSLMKIKRDYSGLPSIIKKMESSRYTLRQAHADLNGEF